MKLSVSHRIVTRFDPPRRRLLQNLRLTPSANSSQKVLNWDIDISDGFVGAEFVDGAGDTTLTVSTPGEIDKMELTISGEVETFNTLGVVEDLEEYVPPIAYLTTTKLVRADAGITQLAKEAMAGLDASKALDRAQALSKAVSGALTKASEPSPELASAAEVLEAGKGSYADYTHVLIAAALSAGIPARFVYGYFVKSAAKLELGVDAEEKSSALVASVWGGHAWAEIWIEGTGWVGFDPYEECCTDESYIRLCSGRDGVDGAPIRGVALGIGNELCEVALDVRGSDQ